VNFFQTDIIRTWNSKNTYFPFLLCYRTAKL
jgi:hypothetical protein